MPDHRETPDHREAYETLMARVEALGADIAAPARAAKPVPVPPETLKLAQRLLREVTRAVRSGSGGRQSLPRQSLPRLAPDADYPMLAVTLGQARAALARHGAARGYDKPAEPASEFENMAELRARLIRRIDEHIDEGVTAGLAEAIRLALPLIKRGETPDIEAITAAAIASTRHDWRGADRVPAK
ncbi:hypothetical protein [Cucumibacter marinus]|uniref:hypothetical protein n=1 Tax=Cucumibacter marinus TaxID=1121252 RepID=UPI0004050998|nr:hypothetical protein [Cucumibacter marinus]